MAVAFLEAAINEVFADAKDGHLSYLKPLDGSIRQGMRQAIAKRRQLNKSLKQFDPEKHRTLKMCQLALQLAQRKLFDRNTSPYEDVSCLIKLRNRLIHYEPETLSALTLDSHQLETMLKARFDPNALMAGSGNPYWPDHCLGYGCARWAVRSSLQFTDEFFCRLGITPNYQRLQLDLTLPDP